jgi:hypothetical protein
MSLRTLPGELPAQEDLMLLQLKSDLENVRPSPKAFRYPH